MHVFCKYCGNKLDDNVKFCSQCGKSVKEKSRKKVTFVSNQTKEAVLNSISKIAVNISELFRKRGKLITVAMIGIIILITVLSMGGKKSHIYEQAMDFMESGEYNQAAELFQELDDYQDAGVQYKEARYLQAKEYESHGNEYEALTICDELLDLDYKTSDVQFLKGNILLKQGSNYQNALNLFEKLAVNDYNGAEEMVKKTRYEWAKDLIRQDQKLEALEMFDMVRDYADVEECQKDLADELFTEALGYYRAGRYQKAQDYFNALYTHKNTTYYLRLTSIYLDIEEYGYDSANELFADPEWSFYMDDFRSNFYVENTAEAMLSCTNLASAYLLGEWRTSNKSHYFKMERNTDEGEYSFYCSYNLPWYDGDYYTIKDGTYYTVKNDEEIVMYRMKLTGPDTLEIYAAKDGKTYILTRKK